MKRILILLAIAVGCSAGLMMCSCNQNNGGEPKDKKPTDVQYGLNLPEQGADEYDVFLLIGQSNMAGRGVLLESDYQPIEGVWLLTADGKIEPAANPLNKYSSIRKDIALQQMNPGYGFSTRIYAKTGRKVLLVVNAKGGTSLTEWKKGSSSGFFSEAVRRTRQAQAYGTLRGILWHQGESGSSNPTNYLAGLATMVADFRAEFNAPRLPFIAGEIGRWHANAEKFNPVIDTIANVITDSACVSSAGCGTIGDNTHFDRDGQILLGQRYALYILNKVYK